MRAREFVVKEQRTDELAPVLGALGAGAKAAGSAIAQGAKAVGGAAVDAVKAGATNLAVAGAKKLAGTQLGQAAIGAVANAAGEPQQQSNASGQAVGTSAAPAGPTTGGQQAAGGAQAQPDQKAQQQQQQQMQQAGQQTMTNLDKIAAQIVALKQDLAKQQQAMK